MKKFIHKIIIFIIPGLLYCLIAIFTMPYLISLQNGPSTKQQITLSFKNALKRDFQLLILGSSKTYRGLNPDYFELNTFNFSHDNDTFNQTYYKLDFLISKKKDLKYLILGVDYFSFSFKSDTRNYVYADFLNANYLKDFKNANILTSKIDYYLSNINPKKLLYLQPKNNKPFLRKNGQYIKPGRATEKDFIKRNINRMTFQEKYFEKTINLCLANNIKIFIVMLPVRQNELNSYTNEEIEEFNNFVKTFENNKSVFYLNYSINDDFKTKDYTDITHFNENAANRFSKILNKDIIKLIEKL